MTTAHYILGQATLMGSAPIPDLNGGSHSIAYFCQSCGDVWGRIVVESAPIFDVTSRACSRHAPESVSSWGSVPGTFCQGRAADLSTMRWAAALEYLPEPVLLREFILLYEHHFKDKT